MCLTTPIEPSSSCITGRAGINTIWVTACENVTDLTFDADALITAITMASGQVFVPIKFEKDTAFLNQALTRPKSGMVVKQTISFTEPGLSPYLRKQLIELNECCCNICIVQDNTGLRHVCGISYNSSTDTFQVEDMKGGEGSANTGANSENDSAEYVQTLMCTASAYAPQLDPTVVIPT